MHNIIYQSYSETLTRERITNIVLDYVSHSGDGYGTDNIVYYGEILDNEDAAREFIQNRDKAFYGGYAVRYYDFSKIKDNGKITELRQKIEETQKKQREYIKAHSVKNQKAAYIGCSNCGSKLNKERLRSEYCPLCNSDLRATSTLERIESYKKRIADYELKIKQERLKSKKKAEVKWLVKFEYHS